METYTNARLKKINAAFKRNDSNEDIGQNFRLTPRTVERYRLLFSRNGTVSQARQYRGGLPEDPPVHVSCPCVVVGNEEFATPTESDIAIKRLEVYLHGEGYEKGCITPGLLVDEMIKKVRYQAEKIDSLNLVIRKLQEGLDKAKSELKLKSSVPDWLPPSDTVIGMVPELSVTTRMGVIVKGPADRVLEIFNVWAGYDFGGK